MLINLLPTTKLINSLHSSLTTKFLYILYDCFTTVNFKLIHEQTVK